MEIKTSIGKRIVDKSNPVFIVGEIGINHNGEIAIAKKLIDMAAIPIFYTFTG